MKKLLGIVVLSLLFSLNAKADNISDFQIEGMSIGDSLLKFYSEKEIKKFIVKKKKQGYIDKSFVRGRIKKNLKIYDEINFHIKKKDSNYIIENIAGLLAFDDKIDECNLEKDKIVNELKELFPNSKYDSATGPHPQDKTNKSIVYTSYFYFKDDSQSRVQCYDWSKKMKSTDHLKISLGSAKYRDWLTNKAWK